MRIALITNDYWPLQSSCAIQMRDLAQALVESGHEPIVIVPTQGFAEGSSNEFVEGVRVLSPASFKTKEISYIRRTLGEILLPFTILSGLRKLGFSIRDLDAVVWYSPTIFFGLLILIMKRASHCKSYLILRDIFPEWMLDLGLMKKGPTYSFFKLFARFQYSVADAIGVQTSSNMDYLTGWARKKPARRLEVLQNWLALAPLAGTSIDIEKTPLAGRNIFVYIGNMGVAQSMDIVIDLAESLRQRKDIGFLFVGRGSEVARLKQNVKQRNLDNVQFFNEIDSKEIPSLLAACHIGLIALDPRHKSHNIPGKFLTYMQAGLPVLARVNTGTDLIEIIERQGVGHAYAGDDVAELRALAEGLIDDKSGLLHMSRRGRALSSNMFSSAAAASQIVATLVDEGQSEK